MRLLSSIIAAVLTVTLAYAGPPEPPEPPEVNVTLEALDDLEALEAFDESLAALKELESFLSGEALEAFDESLATLKGLQSILSLIKEGLEITQISIGGDSITIGFSNDSMIVLSDFDGRRAIRAGKDIVRVGEQIIVEEGEIVRGDVVSAFGDVIVKGTVEGGVLAFSGDIYVTSTGNIKQSAVAVNGTVKKDPGARVGSGVWKTGYRRSLPGIADRTPFRVMGFIFFVIFLAWLVLSATCASIFQANVARVASHIKSNFVASFFKGYLVYLLAFAAFIVLLITILGIPLALLGVPIALCAAMILGSTALSNMLGERMLHAERLSFKTFLYGNVTLGAIPGLFFFVQMITGSMVLMILSWILIGFFLFIIIPIGLGGVLTTRFGTRSGETDAAIRLRS
jgi:hypothetical protein